MSTKSPFPEVAELIRENGGEDINECFQCGSCSASCPWQDYIAFLPRKMFQEAKLGNTNFESDNYWRCVTCNKCVQRCPRGVSIIDIMQAFRRTIIEVGIAETPSALTAISKNLNSTGNPLGEASEKRNNWATDLNISEFTNETEFLFSPCCISSYDPSHRNSVTAAISVMSKAGVDFGILNDVNCCGESVRKYGDESLFQQLAGNNINLFIRQKVKRIIVNSPHCYHTMKNEYPALSGQFEIVHTSQLIENLLLKGHLKLSNEIWRRVTYHDPCYLGRHNNIYETPRNIIKAIPGIELLEMNASKADSLCCGGGGGRIWMETPKEERFSNTRLQQALNTGADTLITSCPYCLSNFKDSALNQAVPESFSILDINELVAQSLLA